MRWKGGKDGRVMRWQGGKGRGVVKWEVPGFIQEWGIQGESRFYLSVSDVNQGNEGDGLKIFLRACRDGKILLRFSASC